MCLYNILPVAESKTLGMCSNTRLMILNLHSELVRPNEAFARPGTKYLK